MSREGIEDQSTPGGQGGARVAYFGGSFDPPHLGHLAVARAARAAFQLDAVLFAPVGVQPLKPEGSSASFEERVAMTKLAIAGETGFAVSLADAPKPDGQPNYTLETLLELRDELGDGSTLFLLMGADSFFSLGRWHRAAEVPFLAPLIVASRPGEPPNTLLSALQGALPEGLRLEAARGTERFRPGVEVRAFALTNAAGERAPFYVLPGLDVEISATEIRNEIQAGQDGGQGVRAQVPAAVAEYVRAHELYR
jgi:nicotinate-nucleotide adenylyltransferase